jgi:hypothetical protein
MAATQQDAAAVPPVPARRTFPLPQELRDNIFRYLLDGREVKDGMFYRFSTAILAVNKTIAQEAEKYLREHNIFVSVHYKTGLHRIFGMHLVPRINSATSVPISMRRLSMAVDLTCLDLDED